jgi:hypothetical protein
MLNVKGIFKGVPSDLATGAGIALSGKALDLIPIAQGQPMIKAVGGYLLLKMVGGKLKGLPGDVVSGLKLGMVANIAGSALAKTGVAGIDSAYVNGTDRYIQIDVPASGSNPSYIEGTESDPFEATF